MVVMESEKIMVHGHWIGDMSGCEICAAEIERLNDGIKAFAAMLDGIPADIPISSDLIQ